MNASTRGKGVGTLLPERGLGGAGKVYDAMAVLRVYESDELRMSSSGISTSIPSSLSDGVGDLSLDETYDSDDVVYVVPDDEAERAGDGWAGIRGLAGNEAAAGAGEEVTDTEADDVLDDIEFEWFLK